MATAQYRAGTLTLSDGAIVPLLVDESGKLMCHVDGLSFTGGVTVDLTPLINMVASAANQATANTALSNILASLGAPGDTANAATNTTAATGVSVWKQISKTLQAAAANAATAFYSRLTDGTNTMAVKPASTAPAAADPAGVVAISPNSWDLGVGTGGTKTPRVAIDQSQLPPLPTAFQNMAAGAQPVFIVIDQILKAISGATEYEDVAAGATNQALGATGAAGDYLECLTITVSTPATSQVQLKDGSNAAYTIFPANPGSGIGTYIIPVGLKSVSGAWQVSTQAGVTVRAAGDFT